VLQLIGSLHGQGARVDLLVGLGRSDVAQLRSSFRPIPQPLQLQALVDTGADVTCLDPAIIRQLALPWVNITYANMPATVGLGLTTQHRAGITILHPSGNRRDHLVVAEILVCELPLSALGLDAVVGRDILDTIRFAYDGPGRAFTLDY
jgi:hypothetical protein